MSGLAKTRGNITLIEAVQIRDKCKEDMLIVADKLNEYSREGPRLRDEMAHVYKLYVDARKLVATMVTKDREVLERR